MWRVCFCIVGWLYCIVLCSCTIGLGYIGFRCLWDFGISFCSGRNSTLNDLFDQICWKLYGLMPFVGNMCSYICKLSYASIYALVSLELMGLQGLVGLSQTCWSRAQRNNFACTIIRSCNGSLQRIFSFRIRSWGVLDLFLTFYLWIVYLRWVS